jgi:hypothetical protein
MRCTRCGGSGFLNLHQVDDETLDRFDATGNHTIILAWIAANVGHDVSVCDCCGDGEEWYGVPGLHDPHNPDDPRECR